MATPQDKRIAAAVRAELAVQRVTMTELAREVFHAPSFFVWDRCKGRTPFTAWELLQVADHLRVDVCQFLAAAKDDGTPDDGAPPPTKFHDEGASYDNTVVDVVFNAPAACLAA